MIKTINTIFEAEQIERVVKMTNGKLPKPVTDALVEFRAKYATFQKAQDTAAEVRAERQALIAEQNAAKTAAAKNGEPDPTDHAALDSMEKKLDYARLTVNETSNESRISGKKLSRLIDEHSEEILNPLSRTFEEKLAVAEKAQTEANKILTPAYKELNDALDAIMTVARLSGRTSIVNAVKVDAAKVKHPKLNDLPTGDTSSALRAIKNKVQPTTRGIETPRLIVW